MTSSSEAPATPDPVIRRARGHVQEFGEDRSCIVSGCTTVLSRYNSGNLCWVHEDRVREATNPKGW